MPWSRWRASPYYQPSMVSLGLHITLIVLLSVSWFLPTSKPALMLQSSAQEPVEIIQATAITEQQYAQEVKKIEQARERAVEQEKQREQQRVAAEKAAAAKIAAEQKRKVEAGQQKIAEQKKAEEAKRIAEQEKIKAAAVAEAKYKAEELRKIEEQKTAAEQQKIAEQKKAEVAAAAKAAAEAKRKAEEQQLLQQQMAAEQAALAAQQQAYVAGELDQYKALINQKISSVWMVPVGADASFVVYLTVRLAPDGSVLSASIQKSSGNSALDQSALDAVYKASPMPVPSDATVFNEMRTLNIQITPQSVM